MSSAGFRKSEIDRAAGVADRRRCVRRARATALGGGLPRPPDGEARVRVTASRRTRPPRSSRRSASGVEPSAPGPLMSRDYRGTEEDTMHICPRAAQPIVAVFSATALAISGCGGGGEERATPTSSPKAHPHQLTDGERRRAVVAGRPKPTQIRQERAVGPARQGHDRDAEPIGAAARRGDRGQRRRRQGKTVNQGAHRP